MDPRWLAEHVGTEPSDVQTRLAGSELDFGVGLWGATFVCTVRGPDLATIARCAPTDAQGNTSVLLYRADEWVYATAAFANNDEPWNRPGLVPLIESHHGPVSSLKQQRLRALDEVRAHATLRAGLGPLQRAAWRRSDAFPFGYHEMSQGVQVLADWWNSQAPLNMRSAAYALLYRYDKATGFFVALGNSDEPAMSAADMANQPCLALFEEADRLYAGLFMQSRERNVCGDLGTSVFFANGELLWEIGADHRRVDDAQYCFHALRELESDFDVDHDELVYASCVPE